MKRYDVVAIGDVNPDLVLAGITEPAPVLGTEQYFDSATRVLGGSTAITAVLLSRLGLSVALIARIGDDDHGRFCRDALQAAGVDIRWLAVDPVHATGLTIALPYATDRLLLTAPGAIHFLGATDLPADLMDSTRHLHVGSFFMQRGIRAEVAAIFSAVRARGVTTSLDTGWAPDGDWDAADLAAALQVTDVFLPNDVELHRVTGIADADDAAAKLLAAGTREIVLKRGPRGAVLYGPGRRVEQEGFAVAARDTTGAGDAFNAGYLASRQSDPSDSNRLRFANACGALAASAIGGTGGILSRADVDPFLASTG